MFRPTGRCMRAICDVRDAESRQCFDVWAGMAGIAHHADPSGRAGQEIAEYGADLVAVVVGDDRRPCRLVEVDRYGRRPLRCRPTPVPWRAPATAPAGHRGSRGRRRTAAGRRRPARRRPRRESDSGSRPARHRGLRHMRDHARCRSPPRSVSHHPTPPLTIHTPVDNLMSQVGKLRGRSSSRGVADTNSYPQGWMWMAVRVRWGLGPAAAVTPVPGAGRRRECPMINNAAGEPARRAGTVARLRYALLVEV